MGRNKNKTKKKKRKSSMCLGRISRRALTHTRYTIHRWELLEVTQNPGNTRDRRTQVLRVCNSKLRMIVVTASLADETPAKLFLSARTDAFILSTLIT